MLPALVVADTDFFERWFAGHRALTLVHVGFGTIFLALAPFQFSTRLRTRHLRLHRWSGRILLVAAVPTVISGFAFAALSPFGGTSAIGFFGSVFVVSMFRGLAAIRRGDQLRHREWMLRMVSVGAGIAAVRVIGLPLMVVTGLGPLALLGASFWLGMGAALLTAELWIRWTRIRTAQPAAVPR